MVSLRKFSPAIFLSGLLLLFSATYSIQSSHADTEQAKEAPIILKAPIKKELLFRTRFPEMRFKGDRVISDVVRSDVIRDIAAGYSWGLLLRQDGTVWAWGVNPSGQLGDGSNVLRRNLVQVKGLGGVGFLTGVFEIAAGGSHSLALLTDGRVVAWGNNQKGQLGDGTTNNKTVPVLVRDIDNLSNELTGVLSVVAGKAHSLALLEDGRVVAWGNNEYGQLGDRTLSTEEPRSTPVVIDECFILGSSFQSCPSFIKVAAGEHRSLAITSEGQVYKWGKKRVAEIERTPNRVDKGYHEGLAGVRAASTGDTGEFAVDREGQVWRRGGTATSYVVNISGMPRMRAVSQGKGFTILLRQDGQLVAQGFNGYGQLGNGSTDNSGRRWIDVLELTNVKKISAGMFNSLALDREGKVWAWGRHGFGEAGEGEIGESNRPIRIPMP